MRYLAEVILYLQLFGRKMLAGRMILLYQLLMITFLYMQKMALHGRRLETYLNAGKISLKDTPIRTTILEGLGGRGRTEQQRAAMSLYGMKSLFHPVE